MLHPAQILENQMKSFTMKALAVAVLGLVGAGNAMALCPAIPAASATPGGGGAWSAQTVNHATVLSATPGLNSTGCALSIALQTGAQSNARAFVTDNSPNLEQRYRARFYINTAALTNFTAANQQVDVMTVLAGSSPAGVSTTEVEVKLAGGNPLTVDFTIADSTSPGNYQTVGLFVPNTGGNYRIEFDLQQGSKTGANCASVTPTGGCFRYWVSDAGTASADATPSGTVAVTNTGWNGAKQANLGLFAPNTRFRTATTNPLGQPVILDEFDSRRQTFIGQ
jgi:hypothetical protein